MTHFIVVMCEMCSSEHLHICVGSISHLEVGKQSSERRCMCQRAASEWGNHKTAILERLEACPNFCFFSRADDKEEVNNADVISTLSARARECELSSETAEDTDNTCPNDRLTLGDACTKERN